MPRTIGSPHDTAGGVASTLNDRDAAGDSVFPCASVARTRNVWGPSPSGWVSSGDEHGAKPPSTAHSNVAPSSLSNANVGVASPSRRRGRR